MWRRACTWVSAWSRACSWHMACSMADAVACVQLSYGTAPRSLTRRDSVVPQTKNTIHRKHRHHAKWASLTHVTTNLPKTRTSTNAAKIKVTTPRSLPLPESSGIVYQGFGLGFPAPRPSRHVALTPRCPHPKTKPDPGLRPLAWRMADNVA